MTNHVTEDTIAGRVLALFKENVSMTTLDVIAKLPNESEDSIKGALFRLRGKGGIKRLRVKGYINMVGRAGLELPVMELGNQPDVVKSFDTIEDNDEIVRRAKALREKREDHRYRKEMAALDNWFD